MSALGESLTKFPFLAEPLREDGFIRWTNANHYRTSYNDMQVRTPVCNKRAIIPKYAGFVPGVRGENMFGRTSTELSRHAFSKERIDAKPHLFASTGFNWTKLPKTDETMHATCRRYGKSTIPLTHPNIRSVSLTTTVRDTFKPPEILPKPNFRASVTGRFTNFTSPAAQCVKSGYIQNSTLFDGTGWVPDRCLHSDLVRTEYRTRFNPMKSFHKQDIPVTSGKLPKKVRVYDREGR